MEWIATVPTLRQPDLKDQLSCYLQLKENMKLQLWSTPSLEWQFFLSLASDVFQVSDGAFKAPVSTCIQPVKGDAS